MKCELKLLDEIIKNMLFNPLKKALIWLNGLAIAISIVIINELTTPESDYVNIGVLVVLIITLGILLHHKCKNKDGV